VQAHTLGEVGNLGIFDREGAKNKLAQFFWDTV